MVLLTSGHPPQRLQVLSMRRGAGNFTASGMKLLHLACGKEGLHGLATSAPPPPIGNLLRGLRRRRPINSLFREWPLCKTLLRDYIVRVELAERSKGTWHGRSIITVLRARPYLARTIMIGE